MASTAWLPQVWSSSSSESSPPFPRYQKLRSQIVEPLPDPEETPDPSGWNLIGLLDHKGGIGNAARTNVRALQQIVGTRRRISFPSLRLRAQDAREIPAIHGHNYLHFNPCSVGMGIMGQCGWFIGATNVGFWAWETTEAPAHWLRYDVQMDQIWVPSQFVKDALLTTGFTTPIWVIPHAVEPQPAHQFPAADKPLTFMVQFDGHSRVERKRPDLSLRSIQQAALRSGEHVRIIIKTHRNESLEYAEYANIEVILNNQWVDDCLMDALWGQVDILVSLNRGEGFGLPMMEAMARGIPVVATHWGATTEYMTERNSYPVQASKIEDCAASGDAYFTTGQWALPDVEHATEQIIRAMEDIRTGNAQKALALAARETAATYSFETMVKKMKTALQTL